MPDHYRFNYSIQILFYCCLDIHYRIHIIRYIMSRHQRLNFIVDYNPIALAFNKLFQHSSFLQSTSNYFSSLFLSKIEKQLEIPKVLFTIGVVALSYKVFSTIYKEINRWKWVSDHFKNRKQLSQNNLKNRYGDCYVVVTGCTEGIGLSFALELARLGFGLVLVARNKEKLERRIVQIKALCPNLRYQKVIGDLSKIDDIKRVSQQLAQLSKRIDIGMVVNNAGLAGQGFTNLINKDVKLLKDIISTNFTSVYHINAALVPSLRLRKHQSAILNVSSCCGTFISHGNGTYTFSKVLLDIYSRAMTLQNKDKIDVLTIRPFGVKTPMMSMRKSKFMITPKDCVLSSLADLGKSETTWTGFLHKVQASYFVDVSEQQRLQMYDKLFQFAKK